MMGWYGDHMGWWGYGSMAIAAIAFWALVIIGIVAIVKYLTSDGQNQRDVPRESSPEDFLATRFARGELNAVEYRDGIAVLRDADGHQR